MKCAYSLLLVILHVTFLLDPGTLIAKKIPQEILERKNFDEKFQKFMEFTKKPLKSYGYWFLHGDPPTTVEDRASIPFNKNENLKSDIVCENGVFTLPQDGIYMVTFGVNTTDPKIFELQLSGQGVPGGKLSSGTGSLTVIFSAKANAQLQLVNMSERQAKIKANKNECVVAYISIQQIR